MSGDPRPASERRGAVRTAVIWDALSDVLHGGGTEATVVDIGGGTGGFAVRVAEAGPRVTVVDPSPDALAALGRRADEQGLGDRITGVQGDVSDLREVLGDQVGTVDLVLCHGVLEYLPDPEAALATIGEVLRPGGRLSLVVAQRHAAVFARAMAGHFAQARGVLEGGLGAPSTGRRAGRRFTREEIEALLERHDFTPQLVQGVRVFADLVPSSLLELEPGAAQALKELEQVVSERPEYLPLATQLHVLGSR